jgi:hypothetical protein
VKNFAHVSKPLTQMLEKGKEFHWDLDCQHAFDTIKGKLSSETRLQLPDFSKPFRLACDASGVAIGAVLSQLDDDGKEKPIAFASKVLSKTERKWTVTERELFALYHFVIHFKQYLYGQPFELISDHKPLVWLRTMKNPSPKLARWLMQLEAFNFTVNYKEGAKNANADVMSRLPEHEEVPETNTLEIVDMESGISREEIRKAQEDNPLVERVMSLLDNNGIWPQTTALRPFYDKKDDLFLHEGILCRQVDDAYTQLVLPPELHERALQYFHDSPVAGHSGIDRTEKRWLQNFYWPNARKIIADYIRACPICEKFKPSKENTKAELQPIISTHPLDLIEIDFVGPLPTSRRNFRYILSIIDHFSKFAMAIPTTRMDSGTVIDCLNKFCSEFGTPNRILSDQARNFISREFLDWCKAWNIRKATSTSYHPQTQGLCERYNQTIMGILKKFAYECPETWCERLPMAIYAYNSAVQDTIGVTPFEVMFGRKPASFAETFANSALEPEVSAYVTSLRKTMKKIHDIIVPRQEQARQDMADRYNSKAAGDCFDIGDQVLLYDPAVKLGDSRKFHPYYSGPFCITDQDGVNCKITPINNDKLREQWIHQNRLKRSYSPIEQPNAARILAHNLPVDTTEEEESDSSGEDDIIIRPMLRRKATSVKPDTITPANMQTPTTLLLVPAPTTPTATIPTVTPAIITAPKVEEIRPQEHNPEPELEPIPELNEEARARSPPPIIPEAPMIKARQKNARSALEDPADKPYQPTRRIADLPRRLNPERNRRRPMRYSDSEYEVNCIDIPTVQSDNTPTTSRLIPKRPSTYKQIIMFFCLMFMLPRSAAVRVVNKTEDLGQLFGPAQVCGSTGHHGMYIALPDKPNCEFMDPRKRLIQKMLITPYFPLTFSEQIDAHSCQVEVTTRKTYKGFWGTKSLLDHSTEFRKLDLEQCTTEVNKIKVHTSAMKEIGHGIFTNDSSPVTDEYYWCCKDHIIQRYRIIIKQFTIRFNFHNKKIISSGFQTEECALSHKYCTLPTATIVWEKNITETCPVKAGSQVQATRILDKETHTWTMLSEEGQMAVSGGTDVSEQCGHVLYATEQGLFVGIDSFNDTKPIKEKLSKKRTRTETTTIESLIQYVVMELEDLVFQLHKSTWLQICRMQQDKQVWMEHLAAKPNEAYLVARLLLNTTAVVAYPSGKLLNTFECDVIDSYFLEPTNKCHKNVPIRYRIHQDEHHGFLLPTSRDIIPTDIDLPCSTPVHMFLLEQAQVKKGRTLYLWNGKTLTSSEANYTSVALIDHAPNLSYLHLISSRIVDTNADNIDVLSDMSSAKNMMLAYAQMTGIDMTILDAEQLAHAATNTLDMVHKTVTSVIDNSFSFLVWLHKFVVFVLICLGVVKPTPGVS